MSWFWKNDFSWMGATADAPQPRWEPFPLEESNLIEVAYQEGKKFIIFHQSRKINFETMMFSDRHSLAAGGAPQEVARVVDAADSRMALVEDMRKKYEQRQQAQTDIVELAEPETTDSDESDEGVYPTLSSFGTPTAFRTRDSAPAPVSAMERTYMQISNLIRRKSGWESKFSNDNIWKKWQEELLSQVEADRDKRNDGGRYRPPDPFGTLSPRAWQHLRDELHWIASRKVGILEPAAVDGVWQADHLIPLELKQELRARVAPLENVPEEKKDWHPGSRKQVLDLVHPSLYPLVFGKTRKLPGRSASAIPALKFMGGGEVVEAGFTKKREKARPYYGPHFPNDDYALSDKFQWLPSEFQIHADGKVTIESYINNLHPIDHRGLYGTIERIFERFVPLFAEALRDLSNATSQARFKVPAMLKDVKYPSKFGHGEQKVNPKIRPIQVPPFKQPEDWGSTFGDLRSSQLQVIVKLANIVLTPRTPRYTGGTWHVEGMENERIVATGIYYYHSENIAESLLSFRRGVQSPTARDYDPDGSETNYINYYYGIKNSLELNEPLGSVETVEDRCIVFPNTHQHRVQPFSLADKTKPGVRKILVFFLVDPETPIISTRQVPPQQRHWYADALRRYVPEFFRLPTDVLNHIVSFVEGCPMTEKEALAHREKLMEERKFVVHETSKTYYEREFSLCEH